MKTIRLAIFDMDGLLLDTERQMWLENEKTVIGKMGYEPSHELLTSIMGSTVSKQAGVFHEFYGEAFDFERYEEDVAALNDRFLIEKGAPKRPGVDDLLSYLKDQGIEMAIATATVRHRAEAMLKEAGIRDYFSHIVSGDEVSHSKPHPEIYLTCFEHFGYGKKDCVIFEDAHNGARAAIAAGIDLILVPDIAPVSDEDKKEAFLVIDSLEKAIPYLKG